MNLFVTFFERYISSIASADCFYKNSDCNGPIAKCHSIPSSAVLSKIASDGHLKTLKNTSTSRLEFQKIGINRASIFTGFCAFHDSSLFKSIDSIETLGKESLNARDYLLLHYRSLAREYWHKINAKNATTRLVEAIKSKNEDFVKKVFPFLRIKKDKDWGFIDISILEYMAEGHQLAINDFQRIHNSIKTQLQNEKYHFTKYRHLVLPFDTKLSVSSALTPISDFKKKRLNNLERDQNDFLGLNLYPIENSTHLIFTWHRRAKRFESLIDQFSEMNLDQIKIQLSKFILAYCENIYFESTFDEKLSEKEKSVIKDIFLNTVGDNNMDLESLDEIDLFK